MYKLPYGISHFGTFIEEAYYYVDRTPYIETLESLPYRYVVLLRPRRFGKSLLVSTLEHYYDEIYKADFQHLFGQYYIGQHPTKEASDYLVLSFNFSGIDTESKESTYAGFLGKVKSGASLFLDKYKTYFTKKTIDDILKSRTPESLIHVLFDKVANLPDKKIYVLIDEYDHFTNELIAFKLNYFKELVSANGFVRRFYETLKIGTGTGVVSRIFITGVSPVTLDGLTSGFNISTNLSTHPLFNEIMGFTKAEVKTMYEGIGFKNLEKALMDAQKWYDGYLFHPKGEHIYNPDMILYLGAHYITANEYPDDLLDENIASDYGKIRRLVRFGSEAEIAHKVIRQILETREISARLIKKFSFDRHFDESNFVSLMYYLGLLTIKRKYYSNLIFTIPNFVIETLYFDYFRTLLEDRDKVYLPQDKTLEAVLALALRNDIQPIIALSEDVLKQLSNRDAVGFDEKYVKTIFTTFFFMSQIYTIYNELETDRRYTDLLCLYRTPIEVNNQLLFELKYLKKEDAKQVKKITKEGREQLNAYLAHDKIKQLENLKAWLVVFVGEQAVVMENLQ